MSARTPLRLIQLNVRTEMTDLDFWISEADAEYTDEVHPFWCFQQRVVFPGLCRKARLWWVFERYFSKVRSPELQRVEYFSSALALSAYSHGNRPPAARRGEVKHLHGNEVRRAAYAWLGPFIQLRCDRWPMKYLCFDTWHQVFSAFFHCRYYFWRRIRGRLHHG